MASSLNWLAAKFCQIAARLILLHCVCAIVPLTAARCSPIPIVISEIYKKSICNHYKLVYVSVENHMFDSKSMCFLYGYISNQAHIKTLV